jgi:hypothetical protein
MWHFCDPDDLIPYHDFHIFMEHAARTMGTETFGLRAGAPNSFETFGTFGMMVARSLTVNHLLDTVCRLMPQHNSGCSYWLAEDGDDLWLSRRPVETFDVGREQTEQYALMQMIKAVRLGAGPHWLPAKIAVQADSQPALEEREALAGAEIRYRQGVTAIAIPRATLPREVSRKPGNAGASDKKLPDRSGKWPERCFARATRGSKRSLRSPACPSAACSGGCARRATATPNWSSRPAI